MLRAPNLSFKMIGEENILERFLYVEYSKDLMTKTIISNQLEANGFLPNSYNIDLGKYSKPVTLLEELKCNPDFMGKYYVSQREPGGISKEQEALEAAKKKQEEEAAKKKQEHNRCQLISTNEQRKILPRKLNLVLVRTLQEL